MDDMVQKCCNEIAEVFENMQFALVGLEGGTKVFDLLLKSIADKYPPEVTVEAYRKILVELYRNNDIF